MSFWELVFWNLAFAIISVFVTVTYLAIRDWRRNPPTEDELQELRDEPPFF